MTQPRASQYYKNQYCIWELCGMSVFTGSTTELQLHTHPMFYWTTLRMYFLWSPGHCHKVRTLLYWAEQNTR